MGHLQSGIRGGADCSIQTREPLLSNQEFLPIVRRLSVCPLFAIASGRKGYLTDCTGFGDSREEGPGPMAQCSGDTHAMDRARPHTPIAVLPMVPVIDFPFYARRKRARALANAT